MYLIISASHTVFTFGSNNFGQLGMGSTESTRQVCEIALLNVVNISCGDTFTVAVTAGRYYANFSKSFG